MTFSKKGYNHDVINRNLPQPSSSNTNLDTRSLRDDDYDTIPYVYTDTNMYTPTGPSAPHKFWKTICNDNLEPHIYHLPNKGITLQDDSMHGLHYFYNKIAIHTSFKKSIHILPHFGKLVTIRSITRLLVPANPDHVRYTTIKSVYDWFGDSTANILQDTIVINGQHTSQDHCIILTHSNTDDGWDLLFTLLTKRCPFWVVNLLMLRPKLLCCI